MHTVTVAAASAGAIWPNNDSSAPLRLHRFHSGADGGRAANRVAADPLPAR